MATRARADQDAAILDQLRSILRRGLEGQSATVYLFGSWATGAQRSTSDIDIAIDSPTHLPPGVMATLRGMLEESTVPYRVDLIELAECGAEFRDRVRREGIVWIASTND